MKGSKLVSAVVTALALGVSSAAFAGTMDNVKALDKDKDGMISKTEAMKAFEERFDAMVKTKGGIAKLTPADVQKVIDEMAKLYGYAQ